MPAASVEASGGVEVIWRFWCWLLQICPKCEQTLMYQGKHYPISRCRRAVPPSQAGEPDRVSKREGE
jgi:hypothetical protein